MFCELFPAATLFTLVHKKGSVSRIIEDMDIRTSFLNGFPGVDKHYRSFLPFFSAAIESFDLSGYDLVLSSSHCVAKGARAPGGALNICYCYTPVRYAWKFFDEYFSRENPVKRWMISKIISRLKKWDIASNKDIDHFVAISDNVKNRIREFYGRDADVIYPPVDVDRHGEREGDKGFYLVVSALVPYKKVDLAVQAFNGNGKRLVIIGDGGDLRQLKSVSGPNIEYLGWTGDSELAHYYAGCRALIFPGDEDFGIVPVEAQAHGKPVIAYAAGGVLETVVPLQAGLPGEASPTGVFFDEQTPSALNAAIEAFESNMELFDPETIRNNALRFNRSRFKDEIEKYVEEKWTVHST
ncbi:MAG: glycosyltransferase [Candidatus Omnitrophota bacterium]